MTEFIAVLTLFLLPYAIGQLVLMLDPALRKGPAAREYQKVLAGSCLAVGLLSATADVVGLELLAALLWAGMVGLGGVLLTTKTVRRVRAAKVARRLNPR